MWELVYRRIGLGNGLYEDVGNAGGTVGITVQSLGCAGQGREMAGKWGSDSAIWGGCCHREWLWGPEGQ